MSRNRWLGLFLVTAQFLCCVALIGGGWRGTWANPWLLVGVIGGVVVGILAIRTMRLSRLRVTPEPGANAELCERGVYAHIRHPMYAGLLFGFAMFAIGWGEGIAWVIWGFLLVVLLKKIGMEEALWSARDPSYVAYRKRTKRLVPWVW